MSRSNSADLTIMTTMSENEKLEVPEQELNQVGVKAFFGLDYESDNSSVNSLEDIHFQPVLEDTLLDKKIRTNTPTTKSRSSTPIQKSPTQSCSTPLLECIDMGRIKAMLGTNDSRRNSSITSLEDVTFLSEADRLADKKIRPITPISRSATPVLKSPTSCNTPLLQG